MPPEPTSHTQFAATSPLESGLEAFPALPRQTHPTPLPESLDLGGIGEAAPNQWKTGRPAFPKPRPKFHLRFIPPTLRGQSEVGVCSAEAISGELRILDNTLVGFFIGKRPSFSYVRSSLLKQWQLQGAVEALQLLHGGLAFRFSSIDDRDKVLENGVFYVGGQPIFLRQWERNLHTGGMLGIKRIPLWVTLPGLPLHLWGEESLSIICSVLGNPLFSDRTTALKSRWAFARICVEFVGDKPLLDMVTIEDDEGNEFLQQVTYEWRPPQCLSCGVFGHAQDSCKRAAGDEMEEGVDGKQPTVSGLKSQVNQEEMPLISTLLQNRPLANLQGRRPARVRKKDPSRHDPTHVHTPLQNNLIQTDHLQEPGNVSSPEGLLGGPSGGPLPSPAAGSLEKVDYSIPNPHFRQSFLHTPGPTSLTPSLVNRFQILESETDKSPSGLSGNPSFSTDPILVSAEPQLDPNLSQILNKKISFVPKPSQPLIQGYKTQVDPNLICPVQKITKSQPLALRSEPDQDDSSPGSPTSGPFLDAHRPSSIGHTPHPSHTTRTTRPKHPTLQSYPLIPSLLFSSARKNYRCFSSDLLDSRSASKSPDQARKAVEDEAKAGGLEEVAGRTWDDERNNPKMKLKDPD